MEVSDVGTDGFTDFDHLPEVAIEVLKRRATSLAQEPEQDQAAQHLELLTFHVGEEWYAVDIESVQEIHSDYRITPLPSVPQQILGVINIRGEITSVTDFRLLLGFPQIEMTDAPVIVVGDGSVETALVVDSIGDIVDVAREAVEAPLSVIDKRHVEYVEGSVAIGDRMIALVNLRKVLKPIGVAS